MLGTIEALLEAPLRRALGDGASLLVGPSAATPTGNQPQLWLFCSGLTRGPDGAVGGIEPAVDDGRSPAFALLQRTLVADAADPARFDLPADAAGSVVEVQSPPGRLQPQGDAYRIDSGRLQFGQAPGAPVVVTWRGDRLRGYVDRRAVQIEIGLGVWAADAAAADRWLADALAALLAAFAERDLIDLVPPPGSADAASGPRMSVRLLRPLASLASIARGVRDADSRRWLRSDAVVVLRGELELSLGLGQPDPATTIRQVRIGIDWPAASSAIKHQDGTVGG